ncbi:SDR family oxidoreductase [Shewanella algae]|uniref:dTDP-4-dehydrorhamnose reductase family protein n=1 Tax=Shewanella algae TaxID=38313 RepID=UPI001184023A|nr:SDR family oxidoreductase [Shewanella algae]MBO2653281.1 SDR family oxidoreductase [Shewanella algae]TVK95899.1 NAD(P)-dependent oxidoreductase [Shewanella algae]
MNVLILGATGMLGYSLFSNLADNAKLAVTGSVRNIQGKRAFFEKYQDKLLQGIDVTNIASLEKAIVETKPDVVINCVGLIKQHSIAKQHVSAIEINALLPHQLAALCDQYKARLIHFSTDCVFDGKQGMYQERDLPTATDLYGKSKCLGEVNYGRHLTLRTSIIGHELDSAVSLVDWFLNQKIEVNGFSRAVFSGLPTCYIAKLLEEKILFNEGVTGLYHLSVDPIDKFSLISLVAETYQKSIVIKKSTHLVIDRSLDSSLLRREIDFTPPSWPKLIECMHNDYLERYIPCKN